MSLKTKQCAAAGVSKASRILLASACMAGVIWFTGCTSQDSSQVRKDAQQQTQEAKQEARQAGQDAKAEIKQGAADVVAAAQGIKAGINSSVGSSSSSTTASSTPAASGMTPDGRTDLNSATVAQLRALPGITPARAHAIVQARPFASPEDTVSRGVLTQAELNRISGRVAAQ